MKCFGRWWWFEGKNSADEGASCDEKGTLHTGRHPECFALHSKIKVPSKGPKVILLECVTTVLSLRSAARDDIRELHSQEAIPKLFSEY